MGNSDVCIVVNEFRENQISFVVYGNEYCNNAELINLAIKVYQTKIDGLNTTMREYGDKDQEPFYDEIYSLKIYEI